jgi:hypothetical protein
MFDLNCAIPMRALLRLSLHVEILTTGNECAKQLLYALDDHVWGIKITALEESANFTTLDTEKMFSKLKSHE